MNNQLSKISIQYEKFSKGQRVDDKQFNKILDFFEDQDRLSRVLLQGVGVVCGFVPKLVYNKNTFKSIQLSQGVAITTDGDLFTLSVTNHDAQRGSLYESDLKIIQLNSKEYTYFKKYDNSKIKYPHFYEDDKQIELWEIATDKEKKSDFSPLNKFLNFTDKYLLLYLESDEKEIKPCRGVDCDNHGVQQIRNLKVLLTNKNGVEFILGKQKSIDYKDKIQPHSLFLDGILSYKKQKRVIVNQLISQSINNMSFSVADLLSLYENAIEYNKYGENIFTNVNLISDMMRLPNVDFDSFRKKIKECLSSTFFYQYAYDVIKDLEETYSEILALLPKSFMKCFPDFLSFPKHILLGKLLSNQKIDVLREQSSSSATVLSKMVSNQKLNSDQNLDASRHQFYNSPILENNLETLKLKSLITRFRLQAESFAIPNVLEEKQLIKIIPSYNIKSLSNKSIPIYYKFSENLLKYWNFDKTITRYFNGNLSYNIDENSSSCHIKKPLDYNIDKNTFFNIEGHHGMELSLVFDEIKNIKEEKQLGFDVVSVSLQKLLKNKNMNNIYFNDYLQKHPGLEHKRGVKIGGTFVLVYDKIDDTDVVVADFSLPYICCTPKTNAKLFLPTDTICANASPIPFTVFPINGVVETVEDSNSDSVVLEDGSYYFDPSKVSKISYNKNIKFAVNGVETDCNIEVKAIPDVSIGVKVLNTPNDSSRETIVGFSITGENISNYSFVWDFWDNGNWITKNPNSDGRIITYSYRNLNVNTIPTIRVKVFGAYCTQYIDIENWYKDDSDPPVQVTINGLEFSSGNCCQVEIPELRININAPNYVSVKDKTFFIKGSVQENSKFFYYWSKISGPAAKLEGVIGNELRVSDIAIGEYRFQLTASDAIKGGFVKSEEIIVIVGDNEA